MILFLHSHRHAARWHIWRTLPLNVLASWGNSYFSTRLKIRRQLDVREANKNKRGREKGRGEEKSLRFWGGQSFTRFLKLGYSIIHLMLQAAVRQRGNTTVFIAHVLSKESVSQPQIQTTQMLHFVKKSFFILKSNPMSVTVFHYLYLQDFNFFPV